LLQTSILVLPTTSKAWSAAWLDHIKPDCAALYLMGDVFDFWFDYDTVIPKGYSRLLGRLADYADERIPVYYFTGNHDLWMFNFVEEEFDIPIIRNPIELKINNINLFLAHGDGLGPGDKGYKRLKKVFTNPLMQWFFKWLHPDIGIRIARAWSIHGNKQYDGETMTFMGEKEWLVQYARKKLETLDINYFIFGHRHAPVNYELNEKSKLINLGDWINHFSYAKCNGNEVELLFFK